MLNIRQLCHSERSEEPEVRYIIRFLATLGMTQLFGIQYNLTLMPANVKMCTYARFYKKLRDLTLERNYNLLVFCCQTL